MASDTTSTSTSESDAGEVGGKDWERIQQLVFVVAGAAIGIFNLRLICCGPGMAGLPNRSLATGGLNEMLEMAQMKLRGFCH